MQIEIEICISVSFVFIVIVLKYVFNKKIEHFLVLFVEFLNDKKVSKIVEA